jgi:hypothetical protein
LAAKAVTREPYAGSSTLISKPRSATSKIKPIIGATRNVTPSIFYIGATRNVTPSIFYIGATRNVTASIFYIGATRNVTTSIFYIGATRNVTASIFYFYFNFGAAKRLRFDLKEEQWLENGPGHLNRFAH